MIICGDCGCSIVPDIVDEPPKYPRFSQLLKSARKSKRISSFEMADLLGVNYKAYFDIENGRELPDDDTLGKINSILFG